MLPTGVECFETFRCELVGVLRSMRVPHDSVEDVLQETWLAELMAADRGIGDRRRWLKGVARNLARMELRRQRVGFRLQQLPDPDETVRARETGAIPRQAIGHGLHALPPVERRMVHMRYWEDRRIAEIAAVIGCSRSTVKRRIAAALERLRKHLEEEA